MIRHKTSKTSQSTVCRNKATQPSLPIHQSGYDTLWFIVLKEPSIVYFQRQERNYVIGKLSLSKNRDNYTMNSCVPITQIQQLSMCCHSYFIYNPTHLLWNQIPDCLTFISPTNNFSVYILKDKDTFLPNFKTVNHT